MLPTDYRQIDAEFTNFLTEIQSNGIPICPQRMQIAYEAVGKKLADITQEVNQQFPHFNPNSVRDWGKMLQDKGVVPSYTPKGTVSIQDENLVKYVLKCPELSILRNYKKAQGAYRRMQALCTKHTVQMANTGVSAVYPTYVSKEELARIAAADINPMSWTPEARAVVGQEDRIFAYADYRAMELHVLATLSKDEALQKALQQDYHTQMALKHFGLSDVKQVTPEQRKLAKTVNFAKMYRGSDRLIYRMLTLAAQEAQIEGKAPYDPPDFNQVKKFSSDWNTSYPKAKEYLDELAKASFQAVSYFGRVYPLNNCPDTETQQKRAVCLPIQNTAADLVKMGANQLLLDERLKLLDVRFHTLIYDAVLMSFPASVDQMTATSFIKENLELVSDEFFLDTEVTYSMTWGEDIWKPAS